MGVTGLWELVAPAGRRVRPETLEGRTMAIDSALWLVQFVKAMRGANGNLIRGAHLIGFFRRICKLLFFRIKPIFVFDGPPTPLKYATLMLRAHLRERHEVKLRAAAEKLLINRLEQRLAGAKKKKPPPPQSTSKEGHSTSSGVDAYQGPDSFDSPLGDASVTRKQSSVASQSPSVERLNEKSISPLDNPQLTPPSRRKRRRGGRNLMEDIFPEIEELDAIEVEEGLLNSAEHRARRVAYYESIPQQFTGFLAGRRRLDDIQVGGDGDTPGKDAPLLRMPAALSVSKALGSLAAHRGEVPHPQTAKIFRESTDFKEYRVVDEFGEERFVQLPLDAEVDPTVFANLPPKIQYSILVQIRDAWFNHSRSCALRSKADVAAFSNIQIESFVRSVRTNKEIEKVKKTLAQQLHETMAKTDDGGQHVIATVEGERGTPPHGSRGTPQRATDRQAVEQASSLLALSGDGTVPSLAAAVARERRRVKAECREVKADGTAPLAPLRGFEEVATTVLREDPGAAWEKMRQALAQPSSAAAVNTTDDVGSFDQAPGVWNHSRRPNALEAAAAFELVIDGCLDDLDDDNAFGVAPSNDVCVLPATLPPTVFETRSDSLPLLPSSTSSYSPSPSTLSPSREAPSKASATKVDVSLNKKIFLQRRQLQRNSNGQITHDGVTATCPGKNTFLDGAAAANVTEVPEEEWSAWVGDAAESAIETMPEHPVQKSRFSAGNLRRSSEASPSPEKADAETDVIPSPATPGQVPTQTLQRSQAALAEVNENALELTRQFPFSSSQGSNVSAADETLEKLRETNTSFQSEKKRLRASARTADDSPFNETIAGERAAPSAPPAAWVPTGTSSSSAGSDSPVTTKTASNLDLPVLPAGIETLAPKSRSRLPATVEGVGAPLQENQGGHNFASEASTKNAVGIADELESPRFSENLRASQASMGASQASSGAASKYTESESQRREHDGPAPPAPSKAGEDGAEFNWDALLDEQSALRAEEDQLMAQVASHKRGADIVTPEMIEEVRELLGLFGLPFVDAPAEAEAQCAVLVQQGLCDSIICDDSDSLLFGASEVYRHFFDRRGVPELYELGEIQSRLGLSRETLILVAMLLGCDYTVGVRGIGIVNAVETARAYPTLDEMKEFRDWATDLVTAAAPRRAKARGAATAAAIGIRETDTAEKVRYKEEHHRFRRQWRFPAIFPDPEVIASFLNPTVDSSTEPFSWGRVDVDAIAAFLLRRTAITTVQLQENLEPVLKLHRLRPVPAKQLSMRDFLAQQRALPLEAAAEIRSRRLKVAVEHLRRRRRRRSPEQPQNAHS